MQSDTEPELMRVRAPSGDVVHRGVADKEYVEIGSRWIEVRCNPELMEDEVAVHVLGDPVPMVVKTK